MESRNESVIPTRSCTDLDKELTSLLNDGYRLDMIMPADDPHTALLSRNEQQVRITTNPQSEIRNPKSGRGRAGMEYRDLIPDRAGGRLIASHIRIKKAGEVPDYVHFHKLRFQMIYCKAGWVRVVYEDQGKPFVMNAGDCVLQPPEIRHRVLEASRGAEVIEISAPAEHETWVDHDLALPTESLKPDREFGGQKFVRHAADDVPWYTEGTVEYRDTGILRASGGFADVRVARLQENQRTRIHRGEPTFVFVLLGEVGFSCSDKAGRLAEGDSIILPAEYETNLTSVSKSELLEVRFHDL